MELRHLLDGERLGQSTESSCAHCFHIEFNEMSACVALYVGSNRLRSRIMLDVDYLLGHRKHIYMVLQ